MYEGTIQDTTKRPNMESSIGREPPRTAFSKEIENVLNIKKTGVRIEKKGFARIVESDNHLLSTLIRIQRLSKTPLAIKENVRKQVGIRKFTYSNKK